MYALPCHQLQRDGDQLAAYALALGLGIGDLRHPDPPLEIKTKTKNRIYLTTKPGAIQQRIAPDRNFI